MSKKNENEKPEVYSLKKGKDSWQFSRRDFLKAAAVGAATVGIGLTVGSKKVVHATDDLSSLCANAKAHKSPITHLAVSPDSKYLASASDDGVIKLWDLQSCALIAEAENTVGVEGFSALIFAPDENGKVLLYAADSYGVCCYDPENELSQAHSEYKLAPGSGKVNALIPLGEDKLCVFRNKEIITISSSLVEISNVDVEVPEPDESLWEWGWNYSIFLKGENALILGNSSHDTPLLKVDLISGDYARTDYASSTTDLKLIPGDSRILARYGMNQVAAVRLSDGAEIWSVPLNVLAMAVSPDGMYAVLNDSSMEYLLMDLNTGETVKKLGTETAKPAAMVISPDGTKLISAVGKALMIRSLPDGKLMGCPVDLSVMKTNEKGVEVKVTDEVTGTTKTITLPCGSPIPDGATCVCNCVAGEVCPCVGNCSCDGYVCPCVGNTCSCEGNCTCNTVSDGTHYWYPN